MSNVPDGPPARFARPPRSTAVIVALLLAALAIRLWLVWAGGQFFWPDEGRYRAARAALAAMHEGRVWPAIASLVGQGDHVGFKLLGLGPAALERWTGVSDPRLAAACFALFSWTGLVWLWVWVRRAGASEPAQVWTVALAAGCTSLTYYARHLLPYDAALALALAALAVGTKERGSLARVFAGGLLAGGSVLVYFGYWLLGGTVLLLLGLGGRETWRRRLLRGGAAALGCAAIVGAVWLADHWGERSLVANSRRLSETITQGDFGRGYRLVGEYFWAAEGLVLVCWIAAVVDGATRLRPGTRRDAAGPAAGWQSLLAVGVIYGGLVAASDVTHRFVVYGRGARQLAPFLCAAGGLALARWLAGRRPIWTWLAAALLAGNAAWHLGPAVTQMFPPEFRQLGDRLLATAPAAEPGRTYYRYVNVEHYLFEAELLPQPPEAVLLARRHPFEFRPYLFEGATARERARRLASDQRMRLVRMRVPAAWAIRGEAHGEVAMRVRFAAGRGGMSEPLLSLGPRGLGVLYFVRYLNERSLVLGMESVGSVVWTSGPLAYSPDRDYEIDFFDGSLLPPAGESPSGEAERRRLYYGNLAEVRWQGNAVLRGLAAPHVVQPDEVYAGYNFIGSGHADTVFSGTIASVRRGGYPPRPADEDGREDCGAFRLVVWLPVAAAEVPEPLLVVGEAGRATLGYVRVLPGGQARFGAELWGVGAFESDPVAAPPEANTTVEFRFPALYPPPGDGRWGGMPRTGQESRRSHLTILVGGRVVLDREVRDNGTPAAPVAFGRNPVGGTWVGEKFSGRLVQVARLPLAPPAGESAP
ncbi:MAG TPA: hypothetical protein VHD61_08785 [Lacunisphaera sp.]|nr:hypothetical protein [Lacunisphaera sp.]